MKNLFKLSVALTILSHVYADLDVDVYEVPATCQSICRPTIELSRICDVDDDLVGENETVEYNNKRACYCSNQSFNVGQMTALCQSCVSQNSFDPRNTREINDLMARCAFQPAQFTAADANRANRIVVNAAPPQGQDRNFGGGKSHRGKQQFKGQDLDKRSPTYGKPYTHGKPGRHDDHHKRDGPKDGPEDHGPEHGPAKFDGPKDDNKGRDGDFDDFDDYYDVNDFDKRGNKRPGVGGYRPGFGGGRRPGFGKPGFGKPGRNGHHRRDVDLDDHNDYDDFDNYYDTDGVNDFDKRGGVPNRPGGFGPRPAPGFGPGFGPNPHGPGRQGRPGWGKPGYGPRHGHPRRDVDGEETLNAVELVEAGDNEINDFNKRGGYGHGGGHGGSKGGHGGHFHGRYEARERSAAYAM